MTVWLLGVLACGANVERDLRAADADARRRALVWMDREALQGDLSQVAFLARSDPDLAVRREAIRNLGWTRSPLALEALASLESDCAVRQAVLWAYALDGSSQACVRVRVLQDVTAVADPSIRNRSVCWRLDLPSGEENGPLPNRCPSTVSPPATQMP